MGAVDLAAVRNVADEGVYSAGFSYSLALPLALALSVFRVEGVLLIERYNRNLDSAAVTSCRCLALIGVPILCNAGKRQIRFRFMII